MSPRIPRVLVFGDPHHCRPIEASLAQVGYRVDSSSRIGLVSACLLRCDRYDLVVVAEYPAETTNFVATVTATQTDEFIRDLRKGRFGQSMGIMPVVVLTHASFIERQKELGDFDNLIVLPGINSAAYLPAIQQIVPVLGA